MNERPAGHDVYVALKRWHPSVVANLEACIEMGVSPNEILVKSKELMPLEAPQFLWDYIEQALEYLALKRKLDARKN